MRQLDVFNGIMEGINGIAGYDVERNPSLEPKGSNAWSIQGVTEENIRRLVLPFTGGRDGRVGWGMSLDAPTLSDSCGMVTGATMLISSGWGYTNRGDVVYYNSDNVKCTFTTGEVYLKFTPYRPSPNTTSTSDVKGSTLSGKNIESTSYIYEGNSIDAIVDLKAEVVNSVIKEDDNFIKLGQYVSGTTSSDPEMWEYAPYGFAAQYGDEAYFRKLIVKEFEGSGISLDTICVYDQATINALTVKSTMCKNTTLSQVTPQFTVDTSIDYGGGSVNFPALMKTGLKVEDGAVIDKLEVEGASTLKGAVDAVTTLDVGGKLTVTGETELKDTVVITGDTLITKGHKLTVYNNDINITGPGGIIKLGDRSTAGNPSQGPGLILDSYNANGYFNDIYANNIHGDNIIGKVPGTVPVGTITMFAGTGTSSLPSGWFYCDGAVKSGADYPILKSICSSYYNKNTDNHSGEDFRLPDMMGKFPLGTNNATLTRIADGTKDGVDKAIRLGIDDMLGASGSTIDEIPLGETVHRQNANELATHYHQFKNAWDGTGNHKSGFDWQSNQDKNATRGDSDEIKNAGLGYVANNLPSFTGINYIIKHD